MAIIPRKIWHYISENHVISIAVKNEVDFWAFNSFYVVDENTQQLYILSSETSLHGKMIQNQAYITGTISDQILDVSHLKGIQFLGKINLLSADHADLALDIYLKKFPIAAKMKEAIWAITFEKIKHTDNSLGFGTKIHWDINTENE